MTDVVNKYHGLSEKSDEGKMSYYCGLQLADRSLYILGVKNERKNKTYARILWGEYTACSLCTAEISSVLSLYLVCKRYQRAVLSFP